MNNIENKVVNITGASPEIGEQTARLLAENGALESMEMSGIFGGSKDKGKRNT